MWLPLVLRLRRQVDELFSASLSDFLDPVRHTHHDIEWTPGALFRVHIFDVAGHGVPADAVAPAASDASASATAGADAAVSTSSSAGTGAGSGSVGAAVTLPSPASVSAATPAADTSGAASATATAYAAAAAAAASRSTAPGSSGTVDGAPALGDDLGVRTVFGLTAAACVQVALVLSVLAPRPGAEPGHAPYPLEPPGGGTYLAVPDLAGALARM